jgi:aryl-alcohol dehydrogenase
VCALAGIAATDAEATLNLNQLRRGRIVRGSLFGDSVPAFFIPRLVEFYRQGRLPVIGSLPSMASMISTEPRMTS